MQLSKHRKLKVDASSPERGKWKKITKTEKGTGLNQRIPTLKPLAFLTLGKSTDKFYVEEWQLPY